MTTIPLQRSERQKRKWQLRSLSLTCTRMNTWTHVDVCVMNKQQKCLISFSVPQSYHLNKLLVLLLYSALFFFTYYIVLNKLLLRYISTNRFDEINQNFKKMSADEREVRRTLTETGGRRRRSPLTPPPPFSLLGRKRSGFNRDLRVTPT